MCGSRNRRDASPESSKKTALPALPREPGKIKDADNDYTLLQYDAHGNRLNRLRLKAGVALAWARSCRRDLEPYARPVSSRAGG